MSHLVDIVNSIQDPKVQEGQQKMEEGDNSCRLNDNENSQSSHGGQQKMDEGDNSCRLNDNENSQSFHGLPSNMERRLKALKKLQLQCTYLEAKFYEEVHRLGCSFNNLYLELFAKREQIVTGKYDPTDEECDFIVGTKEEYPKEVVNKLNYFNTADPNCSGIPHFWLTIFKNVALLNDMVQPHDEPILIYLEDIKVIFLEKDPMGFRLEFYFSENPYFTNKILTKEYIMKCEPDEQDPFSYEGPEIYKCKGCTISWRSGKDITVKVIKKKQKHMSKGDVRIIRKVVKNESFFNFFAPPVVNEDFQVELYDETLALLTSDFEIGHYIKERIVPNAVLYYTGEALEEGSEDDEESSDSDSDSEESSDSDSDSEEFSDTDNDSKVLQKPEGGPNDSKE